MGKKTPPIWGWKCCVRVKKKHRSVCIFPPKQTGINRNNGQNEISSGELKTDNDEAVLEDEMGVWAPSYLLYIEEKRFEEAEY